MQEKHFNILGLAYRARKIALGEDLILQAIRSKEAKLVVIASDSSENTKKKLTDKCKSYQVPYHLIDNREKLSRALGKDDRVAVAVLDQGFAKKLEQLLGD
ncbi:50S ribosomal protein L7ae [Halalkalibacillus sediminis]|uniref:50S ribosomal protein L7ae n=1 Tax=Halalkalibacillus sediminis TaxID=2018042 RepID=A0A2I0QWE6_9BACI|nr:YlxQ family RNA-binding protein [Halalkalibacillus sediminis]PKR78662.1 50S ribosomal protein L7ae [Halalkalibacillus sediminis]